MKRKNRRPQISYGPNIYGVMTWTQDGVKITQSKARKHWDEVTADWSIPAFHEMASLVMIQNLER